MPPAFCRTLRFGCQVQNRCRRSDGRAEGGRQRRTRRDAKHKPVSIKELAFGLPTRAWRTIGWREGSAERLSSRFARLRVRAAHRGERHDEEWLLIEWPKDAHKSRPNIGSRRWTRTSPSSASSILPSCAGASSAIIWNSSRNSGLGIMKVEVGEASITTRHCALPLMDS